MKKLYWFIIIFIFFLSAVIIPFILFVVLYNVEINHFLLSSLFQIVVYGGISLLFVKKKVIPTSKAETQLLSLGMLGKIVFSVIVIFSFLRITRDGLRWVYVGMTGNAYAFLASPLVELNQLLLSLAFFAFVPSIFEELFFRVLPYYLLKNVYSPKKMITVTAIVFSIFHINAGLESIFISLILGVILMKRFIKRKCFFEIVLLHFLYNVLVILFDSTFVFPTDISRISFWADSPAEAQFIGSVFLTFSAASLFVKLSFEKYMCKDKEL